jgi:phosphate transport system permease protein
MSTETGPLPSQPRPRAAALSAWGNLELHDHLFRWVCQSAACLVLVLLVLLVAALVVEAWPAMLHFGFGFLTSTAWNPTGRLGALTFVWGTVMTSALAMLLAVPLGIGAAVYLAEIASGTVRRAGSFLIELLAAIPSVVYGFWGYYFLLPGLASLFAWLDGPLRQVAAVPGLGWVYTANPSGNGILAAGIILAIMIVPYVTAIAFDVCRAVPASQREGALALGSTRWQTIWHVVLPHARPGILGGCFLALGRALGETMAVVMLIGNNNVINFSPLAKGATIASVIANELNESEGLKRSALVELGLVLLLVTVVVNCAARLLIWRAGRPRTGSFRLWPWAAVPPAEPSLSAVVTPTSVPVELDAAGVETDGQVTAAAAPAPAQGENRFARAVDRLMTGGGWRAASVCLTVLAALALLGLLVGWLVSDGTTRGSLFALLAVTATATVLATLGVLGLCLLITLGPLFLILGYITVRGVSALDWSFFTNLPTDSPPGLAHALWGSAMLVGLATLFAVPVGILAAVFLAEYRTSRLAPVVRFVGELLGGVPSIVMGIFGYAVLVAPVGRLNGWAGIFALAVMMIPIVMRASEEALKLVPASLRNASYALGAAHWQTVTRVIVPAAVPAIVTAVFLAIARIAGETAPLLLTADSTAYWASSPSGHTPYLTYYIYFYSQDTSAEHQRLAWAAAFVLLALVMLLNVGIRLAAGRRVISAARAD